MLARQSSRDGESVGKEALNLMLPVMAMAEEYKVGGEQQPDDGERDHRRRWPGPLNLLLLIHLGFQSAPCFNGGTCRDDTNLHPRKKGKSQLLFRIRAEDPDEICCGGR